jgi:chitodextrinase
VCIVLFFVNLLKKPFVRKYRFGMHRSFRGAHRRVVTSTIGVLLSASMLLAGVAALASPAVADDLGPVTYQGPVYGDVSATPPTEDKPQSKLWYAAGTWWALMLSQQTATVHVYRLLADHTWVSASGTVDDRPESTGDALWDAQAQKLYVVSRDSSTAVRVFRLSFDAAAMTWSVDPGFTSTVFNGGVESAALDKDSLGRLWVTWTKSKSVWVTHTTSGDTGWVVPFKPRSPDTTIKADDLSSIVAFRGQVGVMWSDQESGAFRFAIHKDGDPDTIWTTENALAGTNLADDHINLKNFVEDPSGRIFAVVKTSLNDLSTASPTDPLIIVLQRDVDGTWSSHVAGEVQDDATRPIIQVDATNNRLLVFMTAPVSGGTIYLKSSPLSDLSFVKGRGTPFVTWPGKYLNNATGTKQSLTSTTGIVVLACSGGTDRRYYHAEQAITEIGGNQPPTVPTGLTAQLTAASDVSLSWNASTDDSSGGVASYTVYRDGTSIATTAETSYLDTSVQPSTTYRYTVAATDSLGVSSAPSGSVSVTTPGPVGTGSISFVGSSVGANATAKTLVVPRPTQAQAGDVLVAAVTVRGGPTVTGPAGWTKARADQNLTTMGQTIWVHTLASGDPSSWTWSFSSLQAAAGVIGAYSGVDATDPVISDGGQVNDRSSVIGAPAPTTSSSPAVVVAAFGIAQYVTIAHAAPLTERGEVGTPSTQYKVTLSLADAPMTAGSTMQPLSAQASQTAASIGQVLVLRPGS